MYCVRYRFFKLCSLLSPFFPFSAALDVPDEQAVELDFTEDEPVFIGNSVSRQLLISNHTAISASFIIEAEVFCGQRPTESVKKSKHGYA